MSSEAIEALRTLRKSIRVDLNNKADAIATGACTDFPSYREKVGEITGLALAERSLLDLLTVLERENE